MDISGFKNVDKTDWLLTDEDRCQLQRTDIMSITGIYEMFQIERYPGNFREPPHQGQEYFRVHHGHIDMKDYTEEEVVELLGSYDYESLDDFVKQTSPDWDVIYKDDGTIDRINSPSYIVDFALLAEMFFETEIMEYGLPEEYNSWGEAVAAIEEMTGLSLSFVREEEPVLLADKLQEAEERRNRQISNEYAAPEQERG